MANYDFWIPLVLQNFGLSMLILAIVLTLFEWLMRKMVRRSVSFTIFYRWLALLAVGATALYAFAMHAFMPEFTAKTIGWANTPFQYEVAVANLAIGCLALLSFRATYSFRLATVIATTIWLWGDATVHLYEMMTKNNFALGNTGSWLWIDILIPILLIWCIIKMRKSAL